MDPAPPSIARALSGGGVAILDDNREGARRTSRIFRDPAEFCVAKAPDEVGPALARIDAHARGGGHAVGYFAYELGYALGPRLAPLLPPTRGVPLLCVGLYRDVLACPDEDLEAALDLEAAGQEAQVLDCRLNMSEAEYLARQAELKRHIADGDTYEVNYTLKYRFRFRGEPLALYRALRRRQRVAYGAYLAFPGLTVLSRSPELFVRREGEDIETRPMKGTAPRGEDEDDDRERCRRLAEDPKARAENVMIVDLLRNDLSRIARRGTVRASRLYEVETYETLHQMVSTVSAKVDPELPFSALLPALFPCGSITGAPKVRTMEIIHALEVEPRGVYTGAIGYVGPGGRSCLNVAIRTLTLQADGSGEMGVGSGVVHDSEPAAEYEECRLKGRFLTDLASAYELVECVLFDGQYTHLERHLARLAASARALGFELRAAGVRETLARVASGLHGPTKVRLVVDRSGAHRVECAAVAPSGHERKTVVVAGERTRSSDWALAHKVTLRAAYDRAYAWCSRKGHYDALFLNERGEVTEGTFHNVFVRHGDRWFTPPTSSGLLPGIARQLWLDSSGARATERTLSLSDLERADEVVLTNAIRGRIRVVLVPAEAQDDGPPCCA